MEMTGGHSENSVNAGKLNKQHPSKASTRGNVACYALDDQCRGSVGSCHSPS